MIIIKSIVHNNKIKEKKEKNRNFVDLFYATVSLGMYHQLVSTHNYRNYFHHRHFHYRFLKDRWRKCFTAGPRVVGRGGLWGRR